MRKRTEEILKAFFIGEKKSIANTRTDGISIFLHGHKIISKAANVYILSCCGWDTNTTKERLNGFCEFFKVGKGFYTQKGQLFFGELPISPDDVIIIDRITKEVLQIGTDRNKLEEEYA